MTSCYFYTMTRNPDLGILTWTPLHLSPPSPTSIVTSSPAGVDTPIVPPSSTRAFCPHCWTTRKLPIPSFFSLLIIIVSRNSQQLPWLARKQLCQLPLIEYKIYFNLGCLNYLKHFIMVRDYCIFLLLWVVYLTRAHSFQNDKPPFFPWPFSFQAPSFGASTTQLESVSSSFSQKSAKSFSTGPSFHPEKRPSTRRPKDEERRKDLPTPTTPGSSVTVIDDHFHPFFNHTSSSLHPKTQEWAQRYCSLSGLRQTFGTNRNRIWGDLDPKTARKLYKSLLPRALLELLMQEPQMHRAEALAPLAYQARVAAKLYARERSVVPARWAANLYDGTRQFLRHGKFDQKGISYTQLMEKYRKDIVTEKDYDSASFASFTITSKEEDDEEDDVTTQICLRILESSCKTNERVDQWISMLEDEPHQKLDLQLIREQLDKDVQSLLSPLSVTERQFHRQRFKLLRKLVRLKRRFEGFQQQHPHKKNIEHSTEEEEVARAFQTEDKRWLEKWRWWI